MRNKKCQCLKRGFLACHRVETRWVGRRVKRATRLLFFLRAKNFSSGLLHPWNRVPFQRLPPFSPHRDTYVRRKPRLFNPSLWQAATAVVVVVVGCGEFKEGLVEGGGEVGRVFFARSRESEREWDSMTADGGGFEDDFWRRRGGFRGDDWRWWLIVGERRRMKGDELGLWVFSLVWSSRAGKLIIGNAWWFLYCMILLASISFFFLLLILLLLLIIKRSDF